MSASQQPVENIRLASFEEKVVSLAAVAELYGEDHELARPDGGLLSDEVYRDNGSHTVLEGTAAATVRHALEEIATSDRIQSYHRPAARFMLGLEIEKKEDGNTTVIDASDGAKRAQDSEEPPREHTRGYTIKHILKHMILSTAQLPARLAPFIDSGVDNTSHVLSRVGTPNIDASIKFGHLKLSGLPELTSTLSSVSEFSDSVLAEHVMREISKQIARGKEDAVFWGVEVRVIYKALESAAARNETIFDAQAAHMLRGAENKTGKFADADDELSEVNLSK